MDLVRAGLLLGVEARLASGLVTPRFDKGVNPPATTLRCNGLLLAQPHQDDWNAETHLRLVPWQASLQQFRGPRANSDRSPHASSKKGIRMQSPRTRPRGQPALTHTRASIGNGRFAG